MQVWQSIYEELVKSSDNQLSNAILAKIKFREILNNKTIVLTASDDFTRGWFVSNFLPLAENIAKRLYGRSFDFEVELEQDSVIIKPQIKTETEQISGPYYLSLNPKYTFDRFVVGPSNDFAYAAALNVAKHPGQSYNPLFIYGNVALGKTHLLQSIAHKIISENKKYKVLYITSENFTNEFIETIIKQKKAAEFRNKYRNIDVLLIDDIQFFQEKGSTLEEFFHTFNKLFQDRKQMVFACDRSPKQLSAIEDRLRTRFDSGLTVEIQPPSFETRKAILLDKAERENAELPDNVIDYIAKNIESDIRMLEGSLTKLIAYANLKKKNISLSLAKEILRDKIKVEAPRNLSVSDILKVVSKFFGVSVNDLKSRKRLESITYPRQVAMFLSTQHTSLSLTEIGQLFGGKAHTTVSRSSEKIQKLIKTRRKVKKEVEDIISLFYEKKL